MEDHQDKNKKIIDDVITLEEKAEEIKKNIDVLEKLKWRCECAFRRHRYRLYDYQGGYQG